jgi:1-acyl-sn-glycerol-3-phosphate acyltransferase
VSQTLTAVPSRRLAPLRWLLQAVVRLFYRTIALSGEQRVPAGGPVLVVANHPNALVDPVVLGIALRRPVAFLAKSTFFDIPVARLAMAAFGAIPIYRPVDGQSTQRNEETFARCGQLLRQGGWVAIFPEGTTHSEPSLKPFRTGAARIVLGTLAEAGAALGLRVLPVGLLYEDKAIFRSRVVVTVGEAMDSARWKEQASSSHAGVERVSGEIETALHQVVLEAETRELWQGFLAVAAWTDPHAGRELTAREARARELAGAWRRLASSEPERAEALLAFVRQFVRRLQAAGIKNPLRLDPGAGPGLGAMLRSLMPVVLLSPLAVVGALLGWAPYRLVKPLAHVIARGKAELIGTLKALLGLVIMTATYVVEASIAAIWLGWPVGLATLVAGPGTGLIALWFGEHLRRRGSALRAYWVRAKRADTAAQISAGRRELAQMVEAELGKPVHAP